MAQVQNLLLERLNDCNDFECLEPSKNKKNSLSLVPVNLNCPLMVVQGTISSTQSGPNNQDRHFNSFSNY